MHVEFAEVEGVVAHECEVLIRGVEGEKVGLRLAERGVEFGGLHHLVRIGGTNAQAPSAVHDIFAQP